MPAITLTITLDVPEGTGVTIGTSGDALNPPSENHVSPDVLEAIRRLVPKRYLEWVELFVERCVSELGCAVVLPGGDRDDYLNVYPPPRCRRSRVAGVSYASSRTPIYTGPIDLSGFEHAVQTISGGEYRHPKLPHLDSRAAVDEAIELTKIAIARLER